MAIEEVVSAAVARALPGIERAINAAVDARLRSHARVPGTRKRRVPARGEITRWVADTRARRVPTFVIEATGLDTKKAIVAKFGANAAFAKGKPLPSIKLETAKPADTGAKLVREVKAKPPLIRKGAAR